MSENIVNVTLMVSSVVSEEGALVEVLPRPKYQFKSVKVSRTPSKLPPTEDLLTPEMFFFGANRPAYEDLSLDMFMQGYTALLNDDRYTCDLSFIKSSRTA